MKRIFAPVSLPVLILASAAAVYACSNDKGGVSTPAGGGADDNPNADPVAGEDGAAPTGTDEAGAPKHPPGTEDPSGNPILLDDPKTVRTFLPPGGEPAFVDGPQWSTTKNALYVALPYETNLQGGKGILTTFKDDGTNYTELRAGDKLTTGVVGNSVDGQGNLISAELKSITRTVPATGAVTVIATGYGNGQPVAPDAAAPVLTPFDGPNDLIGLKDGTIYFTDPGYSVTPRPAVGHLFVISPAGLATIAETYDYNPSPNGIALTKDEKYLFVSFTAPADTPPFIRKYEINADRTLKDMGKFVEMPGNSEPDGLAIDDNDNIYVALKTGIAVYKSSGEAYGGGAVPQTLIPGGVSALTFGGADRKSLFVCTPGKLLALRTKVPGLLQ